MKKLFRNENNDAIYKIISFFLAVCLWGYVVIILNPDLDVTINDVPVVYSDVDTLTNNNLAIINEQQMKVDVRIRGPRKVLRQINNKNITAMVGLNDYRRAGEYYIPIDIKLPINGATLVSQNPDNVLTIIDKVVTTTKDVQVEVVGSPKNNYFVSDTMANTKSVQITGPDSIIKTIDKVVAAIDVTGATEDRAIETRLKFFSVNGVEIENDLISIEPYKTEVRAAILYRKTVKIEVPLKGKNAYEYNVSVSLPFTDEITIMGKYKDIKDIETIYTEPLDITHVHTPTSGYLKLVLPPNVFTDKDINRIDYNLTIS